MRVGVVVPVVCNFEGAVTLIHSIRTSHQVGLYIQAQWRTRLPLAAAWNNGFDDAVKDGCDYILISNDDIILAPYCIDRLVAEYNRLEPEKVVLITTDNIVGEVDDPQDSLTHSQPDGAPVAVGHPDYACFLVHKTFFDKVGRFDENFWPAWYEDNDSHYRIHLLGLRAVRTTAARAVHVGGVSTHMLGVADSGPSKAYFAKKWGSVNLDMNEDYATPYNDPGLTPRDWI